MLFVYLLCCLLKTIKCLFKKKTNYLGHKNKKDTFYL